MPKQVSHTFFIFLEKLCAIHQKLKNAHISFCCFFLFCLISIIDYAQEEFKGESFLWGGGEGIQYHTMQYNFTIQIYNKKLRFNR